MHPSLLFEHENAVWQPIRLVNSFGWIDLLLPLFTAEGLTELHQKQVAQRDHQAPSLSQVLQEAIKQIEYSARKYFNANRKIWSKAGLTRYVNAYYQDKNLHSLTNRAMHYAPKDRDDVIAFMVRANLNGRFPCMVGVLCEKVETEAHQGKMVHANAAEALSHYHPEYHSEVIITGHRHCYGAEFGDNPAYLMKKLKPETVLPAPLFRTLSRIRERDIEQLEKQAMSALRDAILSDPRIKSSGWIDLTDEQGKTIASVPKLPLACWALKMANTQYRGEYRAYSPTGLKMNNDNPYHTDWMIAAGLDLQEEYRSRHPIQEAAYRWAHAYQCDQRGVEHMVLSNAGKVKGRLIFATEHNAADVQPGDIVVLPHPGAKYQLHLEQACKVKGEGGAITLVGHQAAHLCKVGRERGITLVLVPDLTSRFIEGQIVCIDPDKGTVSAV